MKIQSTDIRISQLFFLSIYYGLLRYLPSHSTPMFGKVASFLRYRCCTHIFKYCGKNVNVERKANFGSGRNIVIGDNSSIGINSCIPSDTVIGKNVMMGPNCFILARNHAFERTDIPMIEQGYYPDKQTCIGDDVWIGRDVLIMPGRTIKDGTIIGGGAVLTKDFEAYSIVGGNPAKLIRMRK